MITVLYWVTMKDFISYRKDQTDGYIQYEKNKMVSVYQQYTLCIIIFCSYVNWYYICMGIYYDKIHYHTNYYIYL